MNQVWSVVVVLLSLSLCVFAVYRETREDYGTGAVNFVWNYKNYYGDQNNSNTNLISNPTDFIITKDGSSVVVGDIDPETGFHLKIFPKNSFHNFTSFYNHYTLPDNGYPTCLEEIAPNTFVFSASASLDPIQIFQNYNFSPMILTTSLANVYSLCYDAPRTTLYISDTGHSRVLAYDVGTSLSNPTFLRLYGKSNISDLDDNYTGAPGNATISNMAKPSFLRVDCFGNLWVIDYVYCRILRYPAGTTTPDLVWGQPDFTSSQCATFSQNTLFWPVDLVFTNDCTAAFVADISRILRFDAPFISNQSASGVLGADSFTQSLPTFDPLERIQLEDFGNKTGLLYIMDQGYDRIVVGITQWNNTYTYPTSTPSSSARSPSITRSVSSVPSNTPSHSSSQPSYSPIPSFTLPCNLTSSSVCTVQQSVVVQSSVLQLNYSLTVIAGSLSIDDSSTVVIGSNQQIQSSQNISLGGQLQVLLSNNPFVKARREEQPQSITLTFFTANESLSGRFDSIIIQNGEIGGGCGVSSEGQYTERSMGVLLRQNSGCGEDKKGGLSNGAIAGIIIGGSFCVIMIIVIAVAIPVVVIVAKKASVRDQRLHQFAL
eukprot:TRINITY_DN1596_c0_g1_i4.p1 TRINITY_DN1596_c0_g1~~TRINITY_DN1596_c0_g1_i4.p1  ORF type:complete len:601 (+),score=82.30 TRINITY_DN1596_c0_g1_i4:83-1885(+)